MKSVVIGIRRFLREEEGANAVEYSLLAGLIAIAIVAGAGLLGTNINTFLNNVAACVATPTVALCTAPFGG
jgi:pilus assembly protein Flp/PilA